MLNVYRILMRLLYTGVYPFGRWKALRGDRAWAQRLNLTPRPQADIWLHAASVGEVRMISYLVNYLRGKDARLTFHVSVMTRAGHQMAISQLAGITEVTFMPLDLPNLMAQAFDFLLPKVLVIAETEIWPNLLVEALNRKCPVVLVNGRMTEKGFRQYSRFAAVFKEPLRAYEHAFLKSEGDLKRFAALGLPESRATVAGDMKFDAPITRWSNAEIAKRRAELGIGGDSFLFVAGSTRPGEEEMLLSMYEALSPAHPQFRLVLVPRHLDRIREVQSLIDGRGRNAMLIETFPPNHCLSSSDILLVDRLGVLNEFYAIADLAFVGGTLMPLGGHNLLEPVWVGTPVLFGPSLFTVQEAADYILANRYGARVEDIAGLSEILAEVIAGKRAFARQTEGLALPSATALAGDYILGLIRNV